MKKQFMLLCVALAAYTLCKGQSAWTLRTNREGVEIYTRTVSHSDFKAVKVRCVLPATLSQLVAVILDVNTGAEWVYSTRSSILLKQVSPAELYYYSEVDLPWPASNRDFVAHLKAMQDPESKVVTILGPTVNGMVPEKEHIVRVKQSMGKWTITPLQKNSVQVEYTLETDPGGSLPAWLVNLFITKGPLETFRKLKAHLQQPAYRQVRLPFITD